jgi:hypothetical protein
MTQITQKEGTTTTKTTYTTTHSQQPSLQDLMGRY